MDGESSEAAMADGLGSRGAAATVAVAEELQCSYSGRAATCYLCGRGATVAQ